jgi:prepilin-type N-terminal cleavage/methylation domain-containing protein
MFGRPFTVRDPCRALRVACSRRPRLATLHASRFTFHASCYAFTLIEIMVVVAIMAIVMTMSVPIVYKVWHKAPMRKAVSELVEVCSNARARAIMRGTMTEVVFHSDDGRFEVSGGGGSGGRGGGGAQIAAPMSGMPTASGSGLSGQLPENVAIASLKINGIRYVPREDVEVHEARVRFFPNGTCDEMRLVFLADSGEFQGVFLEITTSLASVETDRYKLQSEMR